MFEQLDRASQDAVVHLRDDLIYTLLHESGFDPDVLLEYLSHAYQMGSQVT